MSLCSCLILIYMKSVTCSQASLLFVLSVCIQYDTQKRKSGKKKGRPVNVYHVMQDGLEGGFGKGTAVLYFDL